MRKYNLINVEVKLSTVGQFHNVVVFTYKHKRTGALKCVVRDL